MRLVSPRVIRGNRGDLASRHGILCALRERGIKDLVVFSQENREVGPAGFPSVSYGWFYNAIPSIQGFRSLLRADAVLWLAGLDLQDDSSLLKLIHTLVVFSSYRMMGLNIYVLMQGAGPIRTRWGRFLTRLILERVEVFLVRDSRSLELLRSLNSKTRLIPARDGIFAGRCEVEKSDSKDLALVNRLTVRRAGQPLIGFNVRLWFHFAHSLIPYHFVKKRYTDRSREKMSQFIASSVAFVEALRVELNAKVLLVSMYEPETEPWEDDLPHLQKIKNHFPTDEDVQVVGESMSLTAFVSLIGSLDLMVGTRLHAALIALRVGVPAIHLSYTLKGRDIFADLGLSDQVLGLEQFIAQPGTAVKMVRQLLLNKEGHALATQSMEKAISHNERILNDLLSEIRCANPERV